MKKIASLFLALALCMGLAVPVSAAEYSAMTFDGSWSGAWHTDTPSTVTIDKVSTGVNEWGYETYHVPVGATVTLNLGTEGPFYLYGGGFSVAWFFDAASGTMVSASSSNYRDYPALKAGNTYSFTVTKEMADSYAAAKKVATNASPYIDLWAGSWNDFGSELQISLIIFDADESDQPTTPTETEQPTAPATPAEPEQPAAPVTPAVPDAPGTYTVKKGDTWSTICTNFYGTNAQRYDLMKANKGVKLAAGAVITLPEKLGSAALIAAPVAGEGETLYTVKLGDTLGAIAKTAYGDVMKYQAIFERNSDRLKNANTIYEGQVIVLPAK